MNPVPVCLEQRTQKGNNRAFAIGARHVDNRRQTPLRMSKPAEQPFDPPQREIDDTRMQELQAFENIGDVRWCRRNHVPREPRNLRARTTGTVMPHTAYALR